MSVSGQNQNLSPARRRLFRALTVTLALLVCFLCLEITLRVFGPKRYRIPNRDRVYYSNPRGYFDVLAREEDQPLYGINIVCVNYPPQRVPDDWTRENGAPFMSRKNTILGLGDSFTLGAGVRYEDTYLRQLEKLLAKHGNAAWTKNVSYAGYDVEQVLDVYTKESAEQHYPIVIYGFVLNDFGLPHGDRIVGLDYIDYDNGGYRDNPWRRRFATINFIAHQIDMVRLDRVTRKAYLDAFEGDYAKEKFALLAELNRKIRTDGSRLVIVLFPLLYRFDNYPFGEIHQKMSAFCQREKIPLLDLLPVFSRYDEERLWVHPTDRHPNDVAHRVAAEAIHAFLKRQGLLALLSVEPPEQSAPPDADTSDT